jgi:hypothetical protein
MPDWYLFQLPGVLMAAVVLAAAVFMIYLVGRSVEAQARLRSLPIQSALAKVVAKRSEVRGYKRFYTRHFATFEFKDGQRAELETSGPDFGLLVEGDYGKITYQGREFRGFERI